VTVPLAAISALALISPATVHAEDAPLAHGDEAGWQTPEPGQQPPPAPPPLAQSGRGPNIQSGSNANDVSGPNGVV
jgi:hypothetical protein